MEASDKMHPQAEAGIIPFYNDEGVLTVFGKFLELARNPETVNLGQGFPDYPTPDFLKTCLIEAVNEAELNHQYGRPAGSIPLATEFSETYSPRFGRKIDPLTEIVISTGATQSFHNFVNAYCAPGDEAVYIGPCFAYFISPAEALGVKINWVSILNDDGVSFDREAFKAAFNSKTKFIMINSPHNPTGKVFTLEEINFICDFLKTEYPHVLLLSDDVYCDVPFPGNPITTIASLPGMFSRTVTLLSFGKSFGCTGWRIGAAVGPAPIIKAMAAVQTQSTYCTCNLTVVAAAKALKIGRTQPYRGFTNYFEWLAQDFVARKDKILHILSGGNTGLDLCPTEGGYFVVGKIKNAVEGKLPLKYFYKDYATNPNRPQGVLQKFEDWLQLEDIDYSPDYAFCIYMGVERKLVMWPISGFFGPIGAPPKSRLRVDYVRLSLCKSDESIAKLDALFKHNP